MLNGPWSCGTCWLRARHHCSSACSCSTDRQGRGGRQLEVSYGEPRCGRLSLVRDAVLGGEDCELMILLRGDGVVCSKGAITKTPSSMLLWSQVRPGGAGGREARARAGTGRAASRAPRRGAHGPRRRRQLVAVRSGGNLSGNTKSVPAVNLCTPPLARGFCVASACRTARPCNPCCL